MRSNDSITSVDVAHVLFNEESKRLELWLGEAKLYDSVNSAKYKAYDSIKSLWSPDFLNEMKALIGPKIEEDSPYAKELMLLFEDETSIDQVISRIVIPICIAADFPETAKSKVRDDVYISAVYKELISIKEYMKERIPANLDFVIIFIPMDCKSKLEKAINEKVRSYL